MFVMLFAAGCSGAAEPAANGTFVYPPWKHTWGVVRARPFHLRLFLGDKTHFDEPQGLACARLDNWDDPSTSGDDDELTVYGVNSGENCVIYNRSMFALGIYGLEGGQERFDRPWGIAADRKGNVYVADRGNARVVRLLNPGRELRVVGIIGGPGEEPGEFLDPRGVALLVDGRLLVADAGLGRVTVFDDSGRVVSLWAGLAAPVAVAAVGPGEADCYFPRDAFAVVIDSLNRRVQKFTLDGTLLRQSDASTWGAPLTPDLTFLALDYHNQVLITDRNNGCIHKLDRDLNYLARFGERGTGDYEFDEPRGIAIYRRFGQLFIAEREGAQYLWVGVDVAKFAAKMASDSVGRDLYVDFFLTEPATVTLELTDSYGRFIARLLENRRYPSGQNHIAWGMTIPRQLPDGSPLPSLPPPYRPGERLPDGRYLVRASFRAVYSSRGVFTKQDEAGFELRW